MFVGHEFLAFALAGALARVRGHDPTTAHGLGLVAAVAALLPDLDVVYGLVSYVAAVLDGAPLGWDAFWVVTNDLHRVVTHPLPVLCCVAVVFAGGAGIGRTLRVDGRPTLVAAAVGTVGVGGLAAVARFSRPVLDWVGVDGALVLAGFAASVLLVGVVVGRRTDLPLPALVGAGTLGLLEHPFGDVFMAAPPPLLAPVGPDLLTGRVVFAADEAVNLLAVLFVEVATVWAGLLVALRLDGRRLEDVIDWRVGLGVGYAPVALALPRPTMADAHVLGFTVVPLAALVGLSALFGATGPPKERALRAVVTGLATLTVAAAASLVVYVLA
ncbi:metal-dependent hydrolase [Halobium salinum]|uniref:Metal-dependent hydrolase n=1 Tax=Halobium salinum TaxID=1364940 RepID=A0ABD5P9U6_9EURY|nr:metal-dependent hydrolase [Halobium salinum]